MNVLENAIDSLKKQGFENIKAIDPNKSDVPISKPISVTNIDGASNFTIVPLDATSTPEFQDFIYVAIEEGTNNLLEVATISKAPKIYDDQAMNLQLGKELSVASVSIISGYFWKSGLRSFLSTVRRFKADGKDLFLLPSGDIADNLDELMTDA